MSQNTQDHLDIFPCDELSAVVGGVAQRDPHDGGTPATFPPLHHDAPYQQSSEKKCGAPKFTNPGTGAFEGSKAWGVLGNGVPVAVPVAVCPWVPKLVNK